MHWPFKKVPVSLVDPCLSFENRIFADFHSQILYGHLSLAPVLWDGEAGLGLRPHASQEESPEAEIFLGSEASSFLISALLSNLNVASSVNP